MVFQGSVFWQVITHAAWFALSTTKRNWKASKLWLIYHKVGLQNFYKQVYLLNIKLATWTRCNLQLLSGNVDVKWLFINESIIKLLKCFVWMKNKSFILKSKISSNYQYRNCTLLQFTHASNVPNLCAVILMATKASILWTSSLTELI